MRAARRATVLGTSKCSAISATVTDSPNDPRSAANWRSSSKGTNRRSFVLQELVEYRFYLCADFGITLDKFAGLCQTALMFIEGATLAALLKESRSVTAAKAQISVAYLMELIEGRKRNPSADVIRRLSDAIGVSVCVLDVHPSRETLEKELMARIGDDPEALRELLSKVRSLGSAA